MFQLVSLNFSMSVVCFICLFFPFILVWKYGISYQSQNEAPLGCKKLGSMCRSGLVDHHHDRHSAIFSPPEGKKGEIVGRVRSLFIHPVKGCRAVEMTRARVTGMGLEYDRQFSFAQLSSPFPVSLDTPKEDKADHQWAFITQRQYPIMARVTAEIWLPDPSSPSYSINMANVASNGVLVIRFPRVEEKPWLRFIHSLTAVLGYRSETIIQLPYDPTKEQIVESGYSLEKFKIWNDTPMALNMGSTDNPQAPAALDKLREFLGVRNPLGVLRVAHGHHREVLRCAPRKEELGYQSTVGFADAYPLHIMGLASVQDLARRLPPGVPKLDALQFRSNIYIAGPVAYAEDSWKRVRIGEHEYFVVCRTVRCTVPNVDQFTGARHKAEPRKTMLTYRNIDKGAGKKHPCLGMQMVPAGEDAIITVDDEVEVLETGEHEYILQ